jgi:hypothetical protein
MLVGLLFFIPGTFVPAEPVHVFQFCWVYAFGQGNHHANGRDSANDCSNSDLLSSTVVSGVDMGSKTGEDLCTM